MTHKTLTQPARLCVALVAALSVCNLAFAEPAMLSERPVPYEALPVDRLGVPVMVPSACDPETRPDPDRAPEIRLTNVWVPGTNPLTGEQETGDTLYQYEVRYWLVSEQRIPAVVCSPPLPPTVSDRLIDVGQRPKGVHQFVMTGYVDGVEFIQYEPLEAAVGRHHAGPVISGTWYAPDQPGRGVSVNWGSPFSSVLWATHDAAGRQTAVSLLTQRRDTTSSDDLPLSTFEGTAVTTTSGSLSPDPIESVAQDWGFLKFSYVGCGKATLEWDALDPAIKDGRLDLTQLSVPFGIEPCDITQRSAGLVATWID